ncbi:MFS transporter [Brevibacillus sp. B_LB10_24]|uniref:MFS transporter n=1 Tax=Brevibacillus sp. B_LB10_24 TaxID=3380645 RepID=UPI0038B9A29C
MIGNTFVMMAKAMTMPFLAIYLSDRTRMTPAVIGLIIGAGPLASTCSGFLGGTLSDLVGRKKVMIGSLLTTALVFFGFAIAEEPLLLTLLSAAGGVAAAFGFALSQNAAWLIVSMMVLRWERSCSTGRVNRCMCGGTKESQRRYQAERKRADR